MLFRSPALGHNADGNVAAKAATCTEAGVVGGTYCTRCNDGKSVAEAAIPALGHNTDGNVAAKAATCTEAGVVGGTYCTRCNDGKSVAEATIPALGHNTDGNVAAKAATCTETGVVGGTYCTRCNDGKSVAEAAIPALGHSYEWVVDTQPTFDTEGVKHEECTVCHDKRNENTPIDKIVCAHALTKTEAVAATCLSAGNKEYYTCSICGKVYSNAEGTLETTVADCVIAALGHDYDAVVTAPTCTEAGYTTYTCSVCGDTYKADGEAATGHAWTNACDTDCNNGCGTTRTIEHDYEAVVTNPTCTEAGYTTYTCSVCGDTYKADGEAALGHTPGAEATCTTSQTCTVCSAEIAPALGHSHSAAVTDPTCTAAGFTTYTCHCGDSYVADRVPALGHSYETVVTDPTCTAIGFTTYTCECGNSYVADEVPANGHTWQDATCQAPKTCSACGATEGTVADHQLDGEGTCGTCGQNFKRTITFVNADGVSAISGIVGEKINLPTPQRANHTFDGWYLDEDFTTLFKGTTFSEDLTLYAKWNSNQTDQITVLSYNVGVSSWTDENGPTQQAIKNAGYPDVICLQNAGTVWQTLNISGYTASRQNQNKNAQKFLIYYKTDKFDVVTSNYNDYLSYIVLKRKSDGAQFLVVNAYFNNSTDEATQQKQLKAIWDRIDGTWKDQNRGLMPIIITGSFGTNSTPASSSLYKSLTENALFFDSSNVAMAIPGANTADAGNYVFVSYHMQYVVESYNVLACQNNSYPILINVTLTNTCSHIVEKTEAVDATCLTAGNIEYYTCKTCGKIFADVYGTVEVTAEECIVPALGHTAGAAATCESAQTCTRCDYVFAEAIGHAWTNACDTECNNGCGTTREITHDYQWVVDVDPTFDATGIQHEECSICHGKRNENTPVDKLICTHHLTKTAAVPATCLNVGNKEYYTCSICGKVYSDAEGTLETTVADCVIDALGHDIVIDKAVEPTCTETGLTTGQHCSRCDDATLEQTVVDALGHDEESHEAKDPTCTETGWAAYVTCSRCDYTTKVEQDALGHDEESHAAQAPTCTEIGWEAYVTCSRCDYTTKVEEKALGHDKESHVAKDPTCTEIGWAAYETCSRCDYTTKIEKDALGHDYEWVVDTQPTFDVVGVKHEECTRCHDKRNENTPIDKLTCTHDLTKTEAISATCLATGNKEYYTCSICGKIYFDAEGTLETTAEACVTAALGHDKVFNEAQDPTCTEKGWEDHETCSRCDYTTKVEIDALGHNAGAEVTCTTNQTCTRCDYIFVEAIGHNEDGVVEHVDATCVKEGVVGGTYCTACGYLKAAAEAPIAKASHNADGVVEYVAATCTEDGVVGGTYCTVCEYDKALAQKSINKLGHKAGAEATCTTAQTCTRCGEELESALGHKAGEEATCTTAQTCIRCAYVYVAPLGHTRGAEATCTTAQICIVCEVELAPALGHSHNAVVTAPTCTASGYTTYTCRCGDSYVADKVAALGHSYEADVTAPTCTASGYTTYTCRCGASYTTDEVAANGHTWKNATCTAPKTCSVCGATEGDVADHQINGEGVCGTCGQNFKRTISFANADGVSAISGIVGEKINLPTPKKSNYTFAGWYRDSALTDAFRETTYSENMTLYAKWTSNTTDQITVVSFNVNNLSTTTIKNAIKNLNADIICLQEAPSALRNRTANAVFSGYTGGYQNNNTSNVIFYKTDKFDAKASGWTTYENYVILERKTDGARFAVVCAQFDNSTGVAAATREAQVKALNDRIAGIRSGRGIMPIFVACDFNATATNSTAYTFMTETLAQNNVAYACFDAANVAMSKTTGNTYTGSGASVRDYVFIDYTMQNLVESYTVKSMSGGSDHNAIVIKAALPLLCVKNANGHKFTKVAAVAATCTTEGNIEYYRCTGCGRTFSDEKGLFVITAKEYTIPALGHTAGALATCTSAQTCIRCDYVFQEALTHVWTNACDTACNYGCGTTREITHAYEWVIDTEPTFELEGVKHEECTICHHTQSENTPVDKLDCLHHFTKTAAIAATCLTAGSKEYYTCSICDKVYLNEEGTLETTPEACVIPALGHKWVDATCAAPTTCSGCGLTDGEPLAHTWKDATCTAPATCSGCGLTEGEALAHTWKAATCLAPKTCTVCRTTEGGLGDHSIGKGGTCTVCAKDFNRKITFYGGKLASGTYDGDNAEISVITGLVGETITFPTPSILNHNLAGWYLDYACTQPFTGTTFSDDLTLYAKFVSNVAQQISIMSFNLKTGNSSSNGDLVVNTILEYAPDVFGVQEADSGWRNKLNNKLGSTYASVGEYRGTNSIFEGNESNAIYYRTDMFKLITSGTKWLSNTPDQKSRYSYTENGVTYTANYNRIMTYVVLERKSDGARFIYVNTHLDNNGDNAHEVAEKIREGEVNIMMKIIKGLTDSYGNLPVVVTGDFNVIPNNRTAYTAMTQTYGYSDCSNAAKTGDKGAMTYNGEKDDTSQWSIIDYVFVSSALKGSVESYTVCPAKRDGKWVSDHNAIIATIAIS